MGYNWDNKFHSSLYYMREIGEICGHTYETREPSNTYIKDWYLYEFPSAEVDEFHYNVWYLHEIAVKYYPSALPNKGENYYLDIIYEHGDTPSTAYNTTWTLNGSEGVESAIISHADSQNAVFVFTVKDESNNPVANHQIPVEVDGSSVTVEPTDANGQTTYTYVSGGVGDVEITADVVINGTLVSETFVVEDCWKNIPTYSKTGTELMQNVYTFDSVPTDIIIEADLSATNRQYRLVYSTTTNNTENRAIAFGVGGSDNRGLVINTGSGSTSVPYDTYTSYSTPFACKIVKNGNNVSMYIDDNLVGTYNVSAIASSLKYIHINSWSSSKTVTVTNLRIKPL